MYVGNDTDEDVMYSTGGADIELEKGMIARASFLRKDTVTFTRPNGASRSSDPLRSGDAVVVLRQMPGGAREVFEYY